MQISVFGLGYVGCVTAACLAGLGHSVVGVDPDPHKINEVLQGRAPFFEPGLEEMMQTAVTAGRLSACTSPGEILARTDVALLCVGTPSQQNGDIDLRQLRRVVAEIGSALDGRSKPLVVAVRSTVFPGTCEGIVAPALASWPEVTVVSNPEFMREGCAVRDFMEPTLVVVGGSDMESVRRVADLYAPLGVEPCLVSLRTAEMIKYACNAYHAIKVTFANEVGDLCESLGVSGAEVMDTLCRDLKLNISRAYLRPGFAFGGSCLPKDLRAITHRASNLGLKLPLIESALPSNCRHLERAIQSVLELPGRIGVIGLAFKENTDDLRASPAVAMLQSLIGKGREVRVHDPHIRLGSIYGTNQSFILSAVPHIERLVEDDLDQLLGWAEYLVLAQLPDAALLRQVKASGLPVLDLTGAGPITGDSR